MHPAIQLCLRHNGKVVLNRAIGHGWGNAPTDPPDAEKIAVKTDTPFCVYSSAKAITATVVHMLVERGQLSLDDRVSRYLPNLTRAQEVTIRQLLTHTSGYQDYYPQDYVAPFMEKPVTADNILDQWAKKPLDFDPGTRWQYSNTNYVIAGRIVERVTGGPFFDFLSKRILQPLGIDRKSVV